VFLREPVELAVGALFDAGLAQQRARVGPAALLVVVATVGVERDTLLPEDPVVPDDRVAVLSVDDLGSECQAVLTLTAAGPGIRSVT